MQNTVVKALEFTGTMGADLKDFNFVVDLFEGIENAERPYTIVFLKKLDHYRRKVSSDPVFSFARFTI